MDRKELVLAAMSAAEGGVFTPVQVQKLFFVIDAKLASAVGGPHFDFRPYHYGPFDAAVYGTIESLSQRGLAEVGSSESFRMRTFKLTTEGQAKGSALLSKMDPRNRSFIERLCKFVRETPFAELVSAVYRAYPSMRANSIFREPR